MCVLDHDINLSYYQPGSKGLRHTFPGNSCLPGSPRPSTMSALKDILMSGDGFKFSLHSSKQVPPSLAKKGILENPDWSSMLADGSLAAQGFPGRPKASFPAWG